MSSGEEFHPVTRDEPCVICRTGDWCRRTGDGAHECHRIDEPNVNGYVRLVKTPAGFAVYRDPKDRQNDRPPQTGSAQQVSQADLAAEDRKFHAALPPETKATIAQQLGVTVAALDSIGIGRARSEDLKRLRAGGNGWRPYPHVVSTFPECDASGAIVGVLFRADDGRKGSPSGKVGAKRGLIIPSTLIHRDDPVLLVEGPTDVAACETMGIAAVGRPSNTSGGKEIARLLRNRAVIIVGENDKNPAGLHPGRDGAEALAQFLAKAWNQTVRWALAPEGVKDVREYLRRQIENGLDLNDEEACHEAGRQFVAGLAGSATEEHPPAAKSGKDESGAREVVLQLCIKAGDHLFHDNEGNGYVLVQDGGTAQTLLVRSRKYGLLIAKRYFRATSSGLPSTAKAEAMATLEALAIFEGPEEPVFVRCAEHEGKIILDLCDDQWRVVVISKNGWEVVDESPVRFRRSRGMLAIPPPVHGGSIAELRPLINVETDRDFVLLCAFLLACLNPNGPFFILLVNGEAGCAKSTLCRLIRRLIDPNKADLRTQPKDNRDLAITANNSWTIGLDNMSKIPEWLSNALCRLATGGGFATRELYTDVDEAIFDGKRPVLINGIGEVADRSDLIDRAVRLTLPTIAEDQRRTEREFWAEFDTARPRILGALLDAVSAALRNRDSVQLARQPRMADAAAWVVAAESACPWEPGTFLEAFHEQRRDADEFVIEASRLADAVRQWVEQHGPIEGTATDLLDRLSNGMDEKVLKHRDWPKSPQAFGTRLREVTPNLRRLGIEVVFGRGGRKRWITITRNADAPDVLSSLSSSSQPDQEPPPAPDQGGPEVGIDDNAWTSDDNDPPPD